MGLAIVLGLVGVGIVCVVAGFMLSGEKTPEKQDSGPDGASRGRHGTLLWGRRNGRAAIVTRRRPAS
jgi:hypothetical protein